MKQQLSTLICFTLNTYSSSVLVPVMQIHSCLTRTVIQDNLSACSYGNGKDASADFMLPQTRQRSCAICCSLTVLHLTHHLSFLRLPFTCMSILRRKGITKAGFMLLRRPMVQMASSRISNTSSFNATKSACRFSACARWASKRSSKEASTQ